MIGFNQEACNLVGLAVSVPGFFIFAWCPGWVPGWVARSGPCSSAAAVWKTL